MYDQAFIDSYLAKVKKEGGNNILLMQLRMAFLFDIDRAVIDILRNPELSAEVREWIRVSAMEGLPLEQIQSMEQLSLEDLLKTRKTYFARKKDCAQELNQQMDEIRQLLTKERSIESYLQRELEKKDAAIAAANDEKKKAEDQNSTLISKIQKLEEDKERLKEENQSLEEKLSISENTSLCLPLPLSSANRSFWSKRKKKKDAMRVLQLTSKEEFSAEQTEILIESLEYGFSFQDIEVFAKPQYPPKKMIQLRNMLFYVKARREEESHE